MAELNDRITHGILGDIRPNTPAKPAQRERTVNDDAASNPENDESMVGGSQHDRSKHSGSRDVTEGTTVGTETGGTRNYRSGSGAVGTDIGNRPE